MNYLKHFSTKSLALALLVILFTSCKDYTDLDPQTVDTGNADFSSYVAVGNSLTAGFQNDALYQSAQQFSYPLLIAHQVNKSQNFEQPLVSDPGISGDGRIELKSLKPLVTQRNPDQGQPVNGELSQPYNNLGIPGIILADFLGQDLPNAPYAARKEANPFFKVVLRDMGDTQVEQMAAQNPTFITFWAGNNDVLGFVTSGGTGQSITPVDAFNDLYQASAQQLAATGADVVVYNIPNVTNIPFVFYLRTQLEQQGAIVFNDETQSYQLATPEGSFDIYIETQNGPRVMRQSDFPLLSAQKYFGKIQAGEVSPPIMPQDAIPDELVLDGPAGEPEGSSELEQAIIAIKSYNQIIDQVASASGFALVDINSIFGETFETFQASGGEKGYQTDGVNLRPVPSELFSFDGVHPTNRGSAVLANETIKTINHHFGANIPPINVSKIPEGLPVISEPAAAE